MLEIAPDPLVPQGGILLWVSSAVITWDLLKIMAVDTP